MPSRMIAETRANSRLGVDTRALGQLSPAVMSRCYPGGIGCLALLNKHDRIFHQAAFFVLRVKRVMARTT